MSNNYHSFAERVAVRSEMGSLAGRCGTYSGLIAGTMTGIPSRSAARCKMRNCGYREHVAAVFPSRKNAVQGAQIALQPQLSRCNVSPPSGFRLMLSGTATRPTSLPDPRRAAFRLSTEVGKAANKVREGRAVRCAFRSLEGRHDEEP